MAGALRELVLALKIKAEKAAITQTEQAFAAATKNGEKFEKVTAEMLWPLKKIGAQLDVNTRKARDFMKALLPAGALPSRAPEAPSNRAAREQRSALGMPNHKDADYWANLKGPRPGEASLAPGSLKAPNIDDFLDKRSGPKKALDAVREAAAGAASAVNDFAARFNAQFDRAAGVIFNARNALAGFVAVAAGAAVAHFVGDVVKAGAELHTMAQRTRLSVETLQVWRDVASGVNADASAVTSAFQKLSSAMAGAASGNKSQIKAFKDLGVTFKDRSVEDVLIDVGSAIAAVDDDAKASALAVKLLGSSGAALVPAFKGGAAAVRKLTTELRENVVMNADEAARLEEVGSAVERGTKKWIALKTRAIVILLPLIEAIAKGFEGASKWVLRMAKETSTLQTILVQLSGLGLLRLTTGLIAWTAKAGGARAAIAALGQGFQVAAGFLFRFMTPFLLIEDFLTFLAGGKSVFGRAMEEIFGPGGAKSVREGMLAVLTEIKEVLSGSIIEALKGIGESDFFKGAAKAAADAILAVLHAIGFALADNEEKAQKMADALRKNLQGLGIAPSDEKLAALDADKQAQVAAVREGRPNPNQGEKPGWFASVAGGTLEKLGVLTPRADILARAQARAGAVQGEGVVPNPAAPPQPKNVTVTDNRKIEVTVGPNATPAATGRAVAGAVDAQLTKDQRQVLQALY